MASLNTWNISLDINNSYFKSNFSELEDTQPTGKNWVSLVILAIIFFTVAGNILVIMAVSIESKLHNATNYFLCSLAVADMLVGFLVMPASLITILYMLSLPIPVIGFQDKEKVFVNGTCVLNEPLFVLVGSSVAFFVPLVIMVVCYYLTLRDLQKHSSSFPLESKTTDTSPLNRGSSSRKFKLVFRPPRGQDKKAMMQNIKNEQRASKVLGIVFFLFLVMWTPFFITNVLIALCRDDCGEVLYKLINFFVWVGYVSSGVNPLIYTLFNKTYRQAFARYLQCRYREEKKVQSNRTC
ncbi:5-hydroxytryptamine receptor 2C-like isoform X2 [Pimephales promelas]|uniref:5-hydroxytryptamine receptor 2C-like isoform X2 n=1 Tax=Pimephales promelas TaxID=90988 RepID=UPI0019556215|nr:5-hydroxytryptamine receptor 2C-like isoform X2 [Pimephales promelas]